ncbi:leukocyte surface antigen CD53-like isoform X1 [Ruditapes philippinarum]|uniref:leukocyte surface antigen CD53-like isoform X1 n=1 Tax=Ruditapes philippinarum TaxID=129788 RepID=UPI00295B9EE1|nr:leukocyte surface antigen CD53-like isoform X1 [Ruditapes philippinarum]
MGKRTFGGRGEGCGCGIGCGCGCCGNSALCKLCLVLFNTIFLISAAAFVGIGIWVKVEKRFVSLQDLVDHGLGDSTLTNAGLALIGFGLFVVVVSAFGCLAVYRGSKCLIFLYVICLLVIFGCCVAAAVVYGKFKGEIDDSFSNSLKKTIKTYKEGSDNADDWDNVQTWLKCCGSKGPKDYTEVKFNEPYMFVPTTCCVLTNTDADHPTPQNGTQCQMDARMYIDGNITSSHVLETTGCFTSLQDIIYANVATIIGVGVTIAVLQIVTFFLAIGMCMDPENKYRNMT